MNMLIVLGLMLTGDTSAINHLIYKLPNWLAIILHSTAMILFMIGMIVMQKAGG